MTEQEKLDFYRKSLQELNEKNFKLEEAIRDLRRSVEIREQQRVSNLNGIETLLTLIRELEEVTDNESTN